MSLRIPKVALVHVPAGVTITRVERMSPAFAKYYLDDGRVLHRFTRGEPHADPHDHPFDIELRVLAGSYIEEAFSRDWCVRQLVRRGPGDCWTNAAEHIHRIVALPQGECWTIARYGPWRRHTHFWRERGGRVECRRWNSRRWFLVTA